jgi:uncharacterized damage-inducible protein DinB
MKRLVAGCAVAALVTFAPSQLHAQTTSANPMMDSVKVQYNVIKGYLTRTAEKVPENLWSYQPTPDVRTFAQLIGHIANANFLICSAASGEKSTQTGDYEKTLNTKADLSKALADSFAFCDKAVASMDDKRAMESVKFFVGGMQTRGMILAFNTAHDFEHYGNLVTYMRLNKIIPPSSDKPGMD